MDSLQLTWASRPQPLPVEGLAAQGTVAVRLARKLLDRPGPLRGVQADSRLVLLGPPEHLPWCDGLTYLGRPGQQLALYLPIHLTPSLPLEWLAQALKGRCSPPWVLLPDLRVVGLARASALDAPMLRQFIQSWEAKVDAPST